jgi:hypothetical protein
MFEEGNSQQSNGLLVNEEKEEGSLLVNEEKEEGMLYS